MFLKGSSLARVSGMGFSVEDRRIIEVRGRCGYAKTQSLGRSGRGAFEADGIRSRAGAAGAGGHFEAGGRRRVLGRRQLVHRFVRFRIKCRQVQRRAGGGKEPDLVQLPIRQRSESVAEEESPLLLVV